MECLIDNEADDNRSFDSFENFLTTSLDAHVCYECGDTIHPGTEFWKAIASYGIEDDSLENIPQVEFIAHVCKICEGLKRFLCYNSYGNLYEDLYDGIHQSNNPYEVENTMLNSISYTELQWLLRFDVLDLDNDMDEDED